MRIVLGSGELATAMHRRGWTPLREPDAGLALAIAFPIGLAMASILVVLWALLAPASPFDVDAPTLILMVVVLASIHELAHACAFPRIRDPRVATVVISPSRLVFQACYGGDLSRRRLLWILAMPLLAISLAPLLASMIVGHAPGHLALLSLLNALVSGGDIFAIILVLAQVPPAAIIRIEPDVTFWKAAGGRE